MAVPGLPTGPTGPETSPRGASTDQPARAARQGYQDLVKDDPDAQKLIKRVQDRISWQGRTASRWALERQLFENIAFFNGIQWMEYSETTRRFAKWNAPAWFPTPVTNAIAPRVATMQAQILSARPTARVRPNTNDPRDREAAEVGDKFLGHFDDVVDEDAIRQEAASIVTLTGTVIFKDTFNPRAGGMLRVPRTTLVQTQAQLPVAQCPGCAAVAPTPMVGQPCPTCQQGPLAPGSIGRTFSNGAPAMEISKEPELDENGQPAFDEVPEGEIESSARMIFNFYWDPKATRLKDPRWCGEAIYVDLDWIDQNFPDFGPYVAEEGGIDAANFFESSLLALVGPSVQGTAHYGGSQSFTRGAVLRYYEERPSAAYPHGQLAIVANGVLLFKGELPICDEQGIPTGDFSYTEFRYDLVPGRFAGRTPTDDMVPIQKRVNGIDSQVILNRKTMLSPWILAPKGSGINPSAVGMRPGAVIPYNYIGVGAAPQVVPGTPLPQQVYEERSACFEALDQLAQDSRVSLGNVPTGVKSGIALNFLKEQAEEANVPRLQRWAQCHAERGRKRLLLAQRHYREDRAIKIMGDGSDYQVAFWSGVDIRGNVDVSVDPGTMQPRSRSARQQAMFDAAEQGLINIQDPLQRQTMLEEMGLSAFESEIGPDRRRQRKEDATMDTGQMVPINDTDNHEVHLMELLPKIKDPSFDSKPPEVQLAYKQHYMAHKMAMLQQLASQMAPGMAPGGPGSPPGGPPGPGGSPGGGSGVEHGPAHAQNQPNASSAAA